jgi:hypothetical protein
VNSPRAAHLLVSPHPWTHTPATDAPLVPQSLVLMYKKTAKSSKRDSRPPGVQPAPCCTSGPTPRKGRNTSPAPSRNFQAAGHRAHHETQPSSHIDPARTIKTQQLTSARRRGPGRTRLASERTLTERCADSGAAPPAPQHRRQLLATRYLPVETLPTDVFRPPPRYGAGGPARGEQMWKESDLGVGRGGARRWLRFEVA